jgi:tetratricopeptide (TPR) repeat protein
VTSNLEPSIPALRRARSPLSYALLAACLATRVASAREDAVAPEARAEARTLADQGSDAFEAGDFERALALFDRAAAIVHAPTISLMQARTLVELGRLVEAAERYGAAQRIDPADSGNAAFQSAADTAGRELELLKRRIPTLRIKLVGAAAQDAEVVIDGRTLARAATAADQPLDPGSHTVEVRTSAGTSSGRTIALVEGAREELAFSLEPVVSVPAAARAEPGPYSKAVKQPRVAAWVALGSGAAFTGVGAVFGALALGQKSDLDEACTPGCPPDYEDEIKAFRTQRNLSYVGFALGAVGVGAGIYLFLRNEPGEAATALALSPEGVRLSGRW